MRLWMLFFCGKWTSTQFGHCKLSPLSLCCFFFIVEFAVLLSIFWAVLAVILSESFPYYAEIVMETQYSSLLSCTTHHLCQELMKSALWLIATMHDAGPWASESVAFLFVLCVAFLCLKMLNSMSGHLIFRLMKFVRMDSS